MSFTVQIVCERVFGDHLARQLVDEIISIRKFLVLEHWGLCYSLWNTCVVYPLEFNMLPICRSSGLGDTYRNSREYRAVSGIGNVNLETIVIRSVLRL